MRERRRKTLHVGHASQADERERLAHPASVKVSSARECYFNGDPFSNCVTIR